MVYQRISQTSHKTIRVADDADSIKSTNIQIQPSNKRKSSSTSSKRRRNSTASGITNVASLCLIGTALLWVWFLFHFRNHLTENVNLNDVQHHNDHEVIIDTQVQNAVSSNQRRHEELNDSTFLTMYGRHRFEQSYNSLPQWLQDYFTWHREQTTISSNKNNDDTKYAILVCLPNDTLCGGLSDRLRPLLFYLFIASQSNRILCIYWEKPFLLENYLRPVPDVGIDWRCPNEVRTLYDSKKTFDKQPNIKPALFGHCQKNTIPIAPCVQKDLESFQGNKEKYVTLDLATHSNDCINNANILAQRYSYGGGTQGSEDVVLNRNRNYTMPDIKHWEYPELIGDIFRVMFEPIPELAKQINHTMATLGLVENEYVTAHVRARYPAGYIMKYLNATKNHAFDKDGGLKFEGKLKNWMDGIIKNAIKCGHLLAPDLKVFFVSDHNYATHYAMTTDVVDKKKNKVRAIAIDRTEEPLHMDGNHNQNSNVADFYSVFEDLLIMGGSRCVSHGIGSFGSFGAGLTGNKCRAVHRKYSASSVSCPNDRGERKAMLFTEGDMMFHDKPGGDGKIEFKE